MGRPLALVRGQVAFFIGGSLGLPDELLRRADMRLSFGRMTPPHQLIRLVLVEQIIAR
jgi:23S rRNA (pseudouridine1915-N3)-methyltransferase